MAALCCFARQRDTTDAGLVLFKRVPNGLADADVGLDRGRWAIGAGASDLVEAEVFWLNKARSRSSRQSAPEKVSRNAVPAGRVLGTVPVAHDRVEAVATAHRVLVVRANEYAIQ